MVVVGGVVVGNGKGGACGGVAGLAFVELSVILASSEYPALSQ